MKSNIKKLISDNREKVNIYIDKINELTKKEKEINLDILLYSQQLEEKNNKNIKINNVIINKRHNKFKTNKEEYNQTYNIDSKLILKSNNECKNISNNSIDYFVFDKNKEAVKKEYKCFKKSILSNISNLNNSIFSNIKCTDMTNIEQFNSNINIKNNTFLKIPLKYNLNSSDSENNILKDNKDNKENKENNKITEAKSASNRSSKNSKILENKNCNYNSIINSINIKSIRDLINNSIDKKKSINTFHNESYKDKKCNLEKKKKAVGFKKHYSHSIRNLKINSKIFDYSIKYSYKRRVDYSNEVKKNNLRIISKSKSKSNLENYNIKIIDNNRIKNKKHYNNISLTLIKQIKNNTKNFVKAKSKCLNKLTQSNNSNKYMSKVKKLFNKKNPNYCLFNRKIYNGKTDPVNMYNIISKEWKNNKLLYKGKKISVFKNSLSLSRYKSQKFNNILKPIFFKNKT